MQSKCSVHKGCKIYLVLIDEVLSKLSIEVTQLRMEKYCMDDFLQELPIVLLTRETNYKMIFCLNQSNI